MDLISSFIPPILELLALQFLLYCSWRIIKKSKTKIKKLTAPEPSGAWPLIGHLHLLLGQEQPVCKTLGAIADKYGPIFSLKLGSKHPTLIVSSWEMAKDCFSTTNDRILATRASIAGGKYMGYDNAIFALAPYGQYWRDIRKIATTDLLSSHRLELLKHVRYSEVDTLIKDLYSLCCSGNGINPAKVAMSEFVERLTFNISLKLIAGKRFSAGEFGESGSEAWRIKRAIKEATYLFGVFVLGDVMPWLEWVDFQGHVSSMKSVAKEIDDVIGKWLEEHLIRRKLQAESSNINGDERDFIDVLLSKLEEDVIMAGHTRNTVVKAKKAKELKKAQEELDTVSVTQP